MDNPEINKPNNLESKVFGQQLPEDCKPLNNYWVEFGENKIDLPLVEIPRGDGEEKSYAYYLGYPKKLLNGPLKAIVESSPYWGLTNSYEDEYYFYYYLNITRFGNKSIPNDELNKRVAYRWKVGAKAFKQTKRMGGI